MVIIEANYDKEVMSGSQIRTMGSGGRISPERKKTEPEKKRMKSVRNSETGKVERVPVDYKARSDIGTQKPTSTRQSQPEKERGSKEVTQSYAEKVKAERRAAAKARLAAKASGEKVEVGKPKAKEAEKAATQLLSKKKTPTKSSSGDKEDHMIKGSLLPKGEKRPYTRDEKKKIVRTGKRLQADLQKNRERPSSHYQSSLTPGKD